MASWSSLSPAQQQAILDEPALPPPDGVIPNFDNPMKDNATAFVLITLLPTIIAVASLSRAYSRAFILKKIYLEDSKLLYVVCFLVL